MKEIKDYIENGIIKESFEAQVNLNVWSEIGKHSDDLNKLDKSKRELFAFLQRSAQSQLVLRTARIYDHQKNYPTRCLDGLFKKVKDLKLDGASIANPNGLKEYLDRLSCSEEFDPIPVKTKDFLIPFINYCEEEIIRGRNNSDIRLIKTLRDKFIAHNEAIDVSEEFNPNMIKPLTNIAIDISVVIERCLIIDSIYFVEDSANRSSYFIKELIAKELK